MRTILMAWLVLALAGCAERPAFLDGVLGPRETAEPAAAPAPPAEPAPQAAVPPPPTGSGEVGTAVAEAEALAQEQIAAQEAEPPAPPPADGPLGETIATLGAATQPGLWLETPLVDSERPGRLVAENGNSVEVTLIPSGGAPGSGSRISLAAMRVLDVPITDLVPLEVFPA